MHGSGTYYRQTIWGFLIFLCAFPVLLSKPIFGQATSKISVKWPTVLVGGIEEKIRITGLPSAEFKVLVNRKEVEIHEDGDGIYLECGFNEDDVIEVYSGEKQLYRERLTPVPLWLSIIPPLIAIVLALLFREVLTSLFLGLFAGSLIPAFYSNEPYSLIMALPAVMDKYVITALNDSGHLSVIVFSMVIGATVSLISRNGGMNGIVIILSKYAKGRRSGQLVTWLLGILIFFDDYANTLVVGNTMRPITDRLNISREKLSYIVDSTAAPVAAIAFVTTWIGAELGYIQDGINHISAITLSVYQIFLNSLQYSFYPFLTLIFMALLITMRRDFGPMLKAERNVNSKLQGSAVVTTASDQLKDFEAVEGIEGKWFNAVVPILIIVFGTVTGLIYTGWNETVWNDQNLGIFRRLSDIIGNSNPYRALLWSSISSLAVAALLSLAQKLLNIHRVVDSILSGFKTMLTAVIILVLAWSLSKVTEDLHTADFLTALLAGKISPFLFPAATFILAALVSFSTGSSWGTMAILYPLILPLSWILCMEHNMAIDPSLAIFYNSVSCVLAGSVLGDHCSPISDTTILSSLASSCNHIEHVRTQLPYALTVGIVAILAGTIPTSYGVPTYLCGPVSLVILYLIVKKFGKTL